MNESYYIKSVMTTKIVFNPEPGYKALVFHHH